MVLPNDLIRAAFENAIRDFKSSLVDEKLWEEISKMKSIDDVYDATDVLQKEQAGKGLLRHLAKIQPYLEGLRSYASVIEVFIQSKQDILSLIWGPIKLLLHWTNNMKQSFDAVVDAFADIGLLLPEFQEVRKLFSHNEHIKDVLVLFFQDIMNFYLIVLKFFRRKHWRLIFESMWPKQREKIDLVKAQIQRHTLLLRREVGLEHIQEAHNAQQQALKHYERTEKSLRRQEYQSLKTDISPRTYGDRLDSFHARVCQGTGRWLLRDETFARWLDKADASAKILWLQGIPGAGKTFLSSTVVERAKEVQQTRTIYTFLSYTFRSTLTALSILHSLIFQLASDNEDLQDVICQAGGENLKSSLDAAASLLKTLLVGAGPTYIVIDGLDEIDEIERCRLLKRLLEMPETCHEVKILMSSRAEADIADLLKNQISIRVDSRNAGSIQTFVNRRIEEWFGRCNFLPQAQGEIQRLLAPLASNAKGMFLYAEVVLSSLDSLDDLGEIREELRVLPESLDAAYSRIIGRINRLDPPPLKEKVRKIIGWVGCTPMPLKIQEIEQALVVSREGLKGYAVIAVLNMPRICGPIVEVVDDYVQFVHFTVKEYFFSPDIYGSLNFVDATLSLAVCCVTYLCQIHHDHDLLDEDIAHNILSGAYRLHDFAATAWFELVERFIHLSRQDTLSHELIDALETLRCERTQEIYTEGAEASTPSSLEPFKSVSTAVHDMLYKVVDFRRISLKGNFDKNEGSSWTSLDPLTISASSVRIYQQFSDLLCRENKHQNCSCEIIRLHYGQRPFKCGVLSCPFRRHGFESRSLQKSHMKHHDRPWKCSIQDCVYAEGGFLSRKMRDDHYRDHVATGPQEISYAENPEPDEIQPLLFDLVRAGKVEAVRNLLCQFTALPLEIKNPIRECAASFGSAAIIDLIEPFNQNAFPTLILESSLQAGNIDLFKHVLLRSKNCKEMFAGSKYVIVPEVLRSDSEEVFEILLSYIDLDPIIRKNPSSYRHNHVTRSVVIEATAGDPARENWLVAIWEKFSVPKSGARTLSTALVRVASSTCSVRLAEYLVGHGAKANFRRSEAYLTALQYAARRSSAAAAEMMKYLLLQGADPELKAVSSRSRLSIRDEKGAKGIAKWLGMSFDELVAKTKEEREKMTSKSMESAT